MQHSYAVIPILLMAIVSGLAFMLPTTHGSEVGGPPDCTLLVELMWDDYYEIHQAQCGGGCNFPGEARICDLRDAVGPGGIWETKCLCINRQLVPPWRVTTCSVILVHADTPYLECFDGSCQGGCVNNSSGMAQGGRPYEQCNCQ